MVGRRKKTKIGDKVLSHEKDDRLSNLPDPLISEILCHLSTKDAVRTSVLSTKWRNHWKLVPALDLESYKIPSSDAFVSFVERFLYSHRESWIRKLRLSFSHPGKCDLTSWIDAVTTRRIQHLDVSYFSSDEIPLSLYTCETLVHLRLCEVTLCNAEFVSLPCLKIMHLVCNKYPNMTTLQKLISGSPVLEDLTIIRSKIIDTANVLQVRSQTLKRIEIDHFRIAIDAPLLQCLSTQIYLTKNFEIINLDFFTKLDIEVFIYGTTYSRSVIQDILTVVSRVRELVINNAIWKEILLYSNSGPVFQFRDLSRLNAKFSKSDLEMLPTILESCPRLESFVLELVKDEPRGRKKKKEPKVMFSTVPRCLVTSLKFVELKRGIAAYEGEMKLIRYLLKNSKILEKLRLDVYYTQKTKWAFLEELVAIPRCSTACEVLIL